METTAPAILEIGLVLLAAVAAGWVARRVGLPAVVGYLLVGLAVSPFTPGYVADPEQLHLLADVGVVFVAIGTLVNPGDLVVGLPWLAVFLGLIVVTKSGVAYGLARLARLPVRPVQLAVGLGQMGEFGFVLGSALVTAGVITGSLYVALLAAVVISIALSAVAVRWVKGPLSEPAPLG